tara:strand:+ start:286 stop:597 length:312 start_codon:yes stop_codon:yes gene_type:complete
MNARKSKQIRKRALHLLVEWVQLQVPEEESKKININNIKSFMPPDTHLFANNKIILSAYSYRWIIKYIKKIIKHKIININNILLEDIEVFSKQKNFKSKGYQL